jgi:hypothetical protein
MSKIIQVWKADNFGKGVLNGSQDFFRITPDPSPNGGGAVDSVNGQTGVVVLDKSDIGLDQVDNTSDLNKPISTATQTALNERLRCATLNAGSTVNIGTTQTIIFSYPIPANTLKEGKVNLISFHIEILGASNNPELRLYASNNVATLGNQFGFYSNSNNQRQTINIRRLFECLGGQLDPMKTPSGTSRLTNESDAVFGGTPTTVAFDTTVNNWIHVVGVVSTGTRDFQCFKSYLLYE